MSFIIIGQPYYRLSFWYTVSSVCLSVVCDVLYCGKTVRPNEQEAQLKQGLADRTAKTAVSVAI